MRTSVLALSVAATFAMAAPAAAFTCEEKVNALEAKLMMDGNATAGGERKETRTDPTPPTTAETDLKAGVKKNGKLTAGDKAAVPQTGHSSAGTDPLAGFKQSNRPADLTPSVDEAKAKKQLDMAKTALKNGNEAKCSTHADAVLEMYGYRG